MLLLVIEKKIIKGGILIIICECGEIVDDDAFKDYIKTSANPSTSTIGHKKCGHIFNTTGVRRVTNSPSFRLGMK